MHALFLQYIVYCIKCKTIFQATSDHFPVFRFLFMLCRCWESWAAVTSQTDILYLHERSAKYVILYMFFGLYVVRTAQQRERHSLQAEQVWVCLAGICNPVLSHSVIILSSLCHTLHKHFHSRASAWTNNAHHSHTYTHTHTHTHTHTDTHSLSHSHTHTHSHTDTHSLSHRHTLTLTLTHTHTLSHRHTLTLTHTHACWFLWFTGTFHRRNGFYTVQAVCAIALHLPYT